MTRTYTIRVVPSKRGWMAMCNGEQLSIDGRQRNPGVAALALAEKLWKYRDPVIHRVGQTLRYTVQVDDSRPDLGAPRICAPATAAPKPEESAR